MESQPFEIRCSLLHGLFPPVHAGSHVTRVSLPSRDRTQVDIRDVKFKLFLKKSNGKLLLYLETVCLNTIHFLRNKLAKYVFESTL